MKNKKMLLKRLSKVMLIVSSILVLTYGFINSIAATTFDFSNLNKIYGYGNVEYDLTKATTVEVVQNGVSIYGDQISILNQPHVWCAQCGGVIHDGYASYGVTGEYTVNDDCLAYILATGSSIGTLEENYATPHQIAFWKYLYDLKNAGKTNNIFNDIDIIAPYVRT